MIRAAAAGKTIRRRLGRWLLPAALAGLAAACEIENSLDLKNPYLTARTIILLEQRGIPYRLIRGGVVRYPHRFDDAVETARQDAYARSFDTVAVIAAEAQARLIEQQFTSAGVAYSIKDLGYYDLIVWEFPDITAQSR